MDRKQNPLVIRPWNAGRPHTPAVGPHPGKTRSRQARPKQIAKRSKP